MQAKCQIIVLGVHSRHDAQGLHSRQLGMSTCSSISDLVVHTLKKYEDILYY